MKKKLRMLLSAICVLSLGTAAFTTACAGDETPVHKHRCIDREAVAATCSSDGNIAFQECLYCGDYFVDNKKVEHEAVVVPSDPSLHTMEHNEANEASCLRDGNVEYYQCTVCEDTFEDAAGEKPLADPVIYGKHVLKKINAGDATCYIKEHTEHFVCEVCHQVVKGEENSDENKSSLNEVYSGKMSEHNFVDGVCANAGCGAKQVTPELNTNVVCDASAETATENALATVGSWHALKGEADNTSVKSENGALKINLDSNADSVSSVRLVNVPAKEDGTAYIGVYKIEFDLKVTKYNEADAEKTLRIGFSLRSGAGTGKGDIVDYSATLRKTAEADTHHIELFVETTEAGQLLQIELGNVAAANTEKEIEISGIGYTFYPEAARTFVNRLDVTLPEGLPEAVYYAITRISSDSEATTKVPLGQWRYYQGSGSRNNGGKAEGNGFYNGSSITFSGYFGKGSDERLYHRPNVPVGSKITVSFDLSMTMDGVVKVKTAASQTHNLKAGVIQKVSISYTVTSSNYIKLELGVNGVSGAKFPDNGSVTFDINNVVCKAEELGEVHTMGPKVEAKTATCTEAGNAEYYYCSDCKKYFADEAGTTDITNSWSIPALGHAMTHFDAVTQSTCYQKSHPEYYHCGNCKLFYSDEEGNTELENIEFGEKLQHNYVDGVCSNAGCGAKKVTDVGFSIAEGAAGTVGNTVKDALIKNPGTWAVQYSDRNAAITVSEDKTTLTADITTGNAFIRFIPATEGNAFVGAYRVSFDFVVTGTGSVTYTVGYSVQNMSTTLAGDTAANGEMSVDFEAGKTYRFTAYIETLNEGEFFQFTVRNITQKFTLSNFVLEYEPEAAKTGAYAVERIAFAQTAENPPVENNEAMLPETKFGKAA